MSVSPIFTNKLNFLALGCGVCDGSPLIPLFPAPIKRIKTVQERKGHMAASKPRGDDGFQLSIWSAQYISLIDSPKPFKAAIPESLTLNTDELEDNELQIITHKLTCLEM
jgi:hypothetical protein